MEVSTVSPPPASPTQGDDLCDTDVTNVAIHSVTLLICFCGLAGNGALLWLIRLNDIALLVFYLAVADFLFLLFTVPYALLFLWEDVSCSPILLQVYVRFLFQLSMVSYYWALFRVTCITFTVDTDKLFWLCCHYDLPLRVLRLVESVLFWAFFTLFTVIPMVTLLCPAHEQERCRAGFISMFAIILLLFPAPVVIYRTIIFIKAKCGSQQQQPERRDIVLFLMVLFTLLLSLWNFLQQFGYIVVSTQVYFLLTCISSTIKPFIYFLVGRCWRHHSVRSLRVCFQRVFEKPEEKSRGSMDTVALSLLNPSTALMEDPGTVAEGLLEPPDR